MPYVVRYYMIATCRAQVAHGMLQLPSMGVCLFEYGDLSLDKLVMALRYVGWRRQFLPQAGVAPVGQVERRETCARMVRGIVVAAYGWQVYVPISCASLCDRHERGFQEPVDALRNAVALWAAWHGLHVSDAIHVHHGFHVLFELCAAVSDDHLGHLVCADPVIVEGCCDNLGFD